MGLVVHIGLSFLGVKSNEGVTGERRTKVRDDRENRKIGNGEIIPGEARSKVQGRKRKNRKSTKRNRKGKETRQKKDEGKKRTKNGKKKDKGRERSKTKGKKRPKEKIYTRQSCSSNQANYTCMKNALDGMMFEKNQISNYLKQAKRLENHGSISTNKVGKKENFDDARRHLLWALGGNLSNPVCGPNGTSEKYA